MARRTGKRKPISSEMDKAIDVAIKQIFDIPRHCTAVTYHERRMREFFKEGFIAGCAYAKANESPELVKRGTYD